MKLLEARSVWLFSVLPGCLAHSKPTTQPFHSTWLPSKTPTPTHSHSLRLWVLFIPRQVLTSAVLRPTHRSKFCLLMSKVGFLVYKLFLRPNSPALPHSLLPLQPSFSLSRRFSSALRALAALRCPELLGYMVHL